ncbi:hypothetical protein SprV_0200831100 [Sparganum proliferum]
MSEIGTNLLLQGVAERARQQRVIRDAALEKKFLRLSNPTSPRNDNLVHNLPIKELTKDQMQLLRHKASFNMTDAKPVNMSAAVESIISQTEATDETKSRIRHQVSFLLMAHRPREALSKTERDALKELKAEKTSPLRQRTRGVPRLYWTGQTTFKKPKNLTINTTELSSQSEYDDAESRLAHAQVLQLPKLRLKTYCTFDGTVYEQVKSTLMCWPISGIIAEALLQRLESLVIQHHRPKLWVRYVVIPSSLSTVINF